jgi:hypothetical protein
MMAVIMLKAIMAVDLDISGASYDTTGARSNGAGHLRIATVI